MACGVVETRVSLAAWLRLTAIVARFRGWDPDLSKLTPRRRRDVRVAVIQARRAFWDLAYLGTGD